MLANNEAGKAIVDFAHMFRYEEWELRLKFTVRE